MKVIELLKVILLGVVEGVTEWLPVSSTGHMILLNEFIHLQVSPEFMEMFLVVIQLGAIFAVVLLYWNRLWPFGYDHRLVIKEDIFSMWFKVLVATIPAAVVGILFDDFFQEKFYNYKTVSIMLIAFGVLFILVENRNKQIQPRMKTMDDLTYQAALLIGGFQLVAAIFPGTSRSGATIVGALLIGVSRTVAAEFTFFMAVPVMAGASLLKLLKFGGSFTSPEVLYLVVGMVVAFVVSLGVIRFLMKYIQTNDFKVFGWYRIILGVVVLTYFRMVS